MPFLSHHPAEMLRQIKETKVNMMAMAQDQLDDITKRAMIENERLKIELQFHVSVWVFFSPLFVYSFSAFVQRKERGILFCDSH